MCVSYPEYSLSKLGFHAFGRGVPTSIILRVSGEERILALDVGSKTIGLAVSDPLGLTAQGLETIRRKNKRTDFEQLRQVIAQYEVREIVVGHPLYMSGDASPQSSRVSELAEDVRQRFNLP